MTSEADQPSQDDGSEQKYDLFTRDGHEMVLIRLTDHGVKLGHGHVGWTTAGHPQSVPLKDIAGIRLLTGTQSVEGPVGMTQCQISFASGNGVKVFSSDALGFHDPGREALYRNFVEDLHRRLGAAERANIQFIAGFGTGRYWFLLAMISLLTLSVIGGIGLALLLGGLGIHITLFAIAVAAMTAAFVRMLQVNAPHAYDPANPLESATQGSIGDIIAHAFVEIYRIFGTRLLLLLAAAGFAIVAMAVLAVGARQNVNLFEPGRARHAFEIIQAASPGRRITKVKVTADTVMVRFSPLGSSSAPTEMTASRARLPGWGEWDRLFGPRLNYDVPVGDDWGAFEAQTDDLAKFDELISGAIDRAGLGAGSVIGATVLDKAPDYAMNCLGLVAEPHWTVHISNGRRVATIFADRRGDLLPGKCARDLED